MDFMELPVFFAIHKIYGMTSITPQPTNITLHSKSKVLEISFDNGERFELSCEYLRAFSPSAEVMGHGPGQEVLQIGKENVNITKIEPVGQYAVTLVFDDGHQTGIYSWDYLYGLGKFKEENLEHYLRRLEEAGYQRVPFGKEGE